MDIAKLHIPRRLKPKTTPTFSRKPAETAKPLFRQSQSQKRPRRFLAPTQAIPTRLIRPTACFREFTKGGLVKGGLAIYVLKTSQIAKPPFTKPPFVNSRLVAVSRFAGCSRASRAMQTSRLARALTKMVPGCYIRLYYIVL